MLRTLYVDDEVPLLNLFARFAIAAGHEVTIVDKVAYAWGAIEAGHQFNQFDCIISDLDMPDMDGISFLRKVRSDPRTKDIPFVLISGRRSNDLFSGRMLREICAELNAKFFHKSGENIFRQDILPYLEELGKKKDAP